MKKAELSWILLLSFGFSKGSEIIVEEGRDFILECLWPDKDLTDDLFGWMLNGLIRVFEYKEGSHSNNGLTDQARQFSGRVSHFPEALKDGNASIKIQAAKITDSGSYTCFLPREGPESSRTTEVKVGSEIIVEAGRDFILECLWPDKNLTGDLFGWKLNGLIRVFEYKEGSHSNNGLTDQARQFSGRVSYFPEALKDGNASIKIQSAKITDSGSYTCSLPREGRSGTIEVKVGVSPKPRLFTPDSHQLVCEVDGAFPEPKVEFQDPTGSIIPPEDTHTSVEEQRYYVRTSVHVTKTRKYTCVSRQEPIHRQTSTTTFIHTYDETYGLMIGLIISVIINLVAVVTVVCLVNTGHLRLTCPQGPEVVQADGSDGHQCSDLRTPQEDIGSCLASDESSEEQSDPEAEG